MHTPIHQVKITPGNCYLAQNNGRRLATFFKIAMVTISVLILSCSNLFAQCLSTATLSQIGETCGVSLSSWDTDNSGVTFIYYKLVGPSSSAPTDSMDPSMGTWTGLSAGTYHIEGYSDACGGSWQRITSDVVISGSVSAGTISPASSKVVYGGSPGQITGSAVSGVSYQWQSSSDNSSWSSISGANSQNYTPTGLTSSVYFRRVVSSTCASGASGSVLITVFSPLVAGGAGFSQTLNFGDYSVELGGPPANNGDTDYDVSFQWEESQDNSFFSPKSGETSQSFNPGVQTSTIYYRRADTRGSETVYSYFAIYVYPPLTAGSISGSQTINYNTAPSTLTSSVPAGGGSGTYDYFWQYSTASVGWTTIGGTNSESYSPGALTETTSFRRWVSSNGKSELTGTVTVSVYPQVTGGGIGSSQTINYGAAPDGLISVVGAGGGTGGYTYQWQSSTDNSSYSDIGGATSSDYSPGYLYQTTYFRRQAKSNGAIALSGVVTITVYAQLTAGSVGSAQTINYGASPAGFTNVAWPGGGDGLYAYQWQYSTNASSWYDISGATGSSYSSPGLTSSTYFRRQVKNNGAEAYTGYFLVTVYPQLTAGSIGSAQTINYSDIPSALTGTSPGGGDGSYSYQWQSSGDGSSWTDISGQVGTSYSPGSLTSSTYYRRNVTSNSSLVYGNSVLITVYPQLTGGTISASVTSIGYNTDAGLLSSPVPAGGGTGSYSYLWEKFPTGGSWTSTGATGEIYDPTENLTVTTKYRRRVSSNGAVAYSNEITITVNVNSAPSANAGSDQTIYTPSTTATLSGSGSDSDGSITSYAWTQQSGPNTAGISSSSTSTSGISGLVVGTYVFRLTVTDNNGATGYDDVSIVVRAPNASPFVSAGADQTIEQPTSTTSFSGTATDSDGSIATYAWTQQSGPTTASIGSASSASTSVSGLSLGTYVFRLTATDNDAASGYDDIVVTVVAGGSMYNYVREIIIKRDSIKTLSAVSALSTTLKNVSTTYFDGIGRPIQKVQHQISPSGKDIIQPIEYDAYGKESKKYLPYADPSAAYGNFRATAITAQNTFYNAPPTGVVQIAASSGVTPSFAETRLEASPLSRPLEQGAPGSSWQLAQHHTVRTKYDLYNNDVSFATDNVNGRQVALYTVSIASNGKRSLQRTGNNATYANNQLTVTVVRDENGRSDRAGSTEEYKDKSGKVILKRAYNLNHSGVLQCLSTYYVYDDFGSLCFVLTPGANPDATSAISAATLANFCYSYRYDGDQRLVEKRIPGKGTEYMVYDQLDRVVASQDSVQRVKTNPEWNFSKFDVQGRAIGSGTWVFNNTTAISRTALQAKVDSISTPWETPPSSTVNLTDVGYSDQAFPASGSGVKKWNSLTYFDAYTNLSLTDLGYSSKFSQSNVTDIKGLAAVSKVRILGTSNWLLTANYYDDKARLIQTQAMNNVAGKDVYSTKFNFTGTIDKSERNHYKSSMSSSSLTIGERFTYDAAERMLKHFHKVNSQMEITLASNTYNEIGQLKQKAMHDAYGSLPADVTLGSADKVLSGQTVTKKAAISITLSPGFEVASGGTFSASIEPGGSQQIVSYTYNERGWLSTVNDPTSVTGDKAFSMKLYYADHSTAARRQYNGNISRMDWQSKIPAEYSGTLTQQLQNYDYTYDKLNRLDTAAYVTSGSSGKFNEYLDYDVMGNIVTLKRSNSTSGYMHNFTYDYSSGGAGNKLWGITDAGTAGLTGTYSYDGNGNQLTDSKKAVALQYNELNLPRLVSKTGSTDTLKYTYDAAGQKLKKVLGSSTRDYVNGIEYNNGSIEFVQTSEGRMIPNSGTYVYQYALKDHLGNTRAMVKEDGIILQVQDYYAFGLALNANNTITPSPDNQYKYNGKDLNTEHGLNEYDYGARFYDPVVARWNVVDPLSENHTDLTPYNYVMNNPLMYGDEFGMDTTKTITLKEVNIVAKGATNKLQGGVPFNWVDLDYTKKQNEAAAGSRAALKEIGIQTAMFFMPVSRIAKVTGIARLAGLFGERLVPEVAALGAQKMIKILNSSHAWNKVVAVVGEADVKALMSKVLSEGAEMPYANTAMGSSSKVLQYNGEIIQVTTNRVGGRVVVSDAWVITEPSYKWQALKTLSGGK